MKSRFFALTLLVAAAGLLTAQTPAPPNAGTVALEEAEAWSIVGDWHVTHPNWTDIITLRKDGTLVTKNQGTTGRWVLTADTGTPLLVLKWDRWSAESLSMVSLEHFRGQTMPGSLIDMRRGD